MSNFDDYSADDLMREISQSLGAQVTSEIENIKQENKEDTLEPPIENTKKKKKGRKRMIAGIIAGVLVVACFAVVIAGNYFLDRLNYEKESDIDLVTESGEPLDLKNSDTNVEPADDTVINVLLIGEEKINDGARGRSDSMMVATINQKQKSLKLTSIMRDCYVSIPGYRDNKLNAAYNYGGGPLLLATIEQNFQIHLDGYVRVDFEAFEAIIDKLGGVEIELSQAEANYLNRTNYISNPAYRTMKAGINTMNGNQALGYSPVRYVK
jgi:LCP family protein required for cell wall assembly